ncbi:MAG TPA: phosphoenolpyruvate--protein phosphotransferase [Thermodesulfobacteriota bacterium]|nr:phosphoenolpyruvate--protein phosphotransferase [Thermodesulfobacteriota bacterium]
MQQEISKWFLKGIAASPGIVIGEAYVLQDILLRVESRSLEKTHADEEVARLKGAIRRVIDELMEDNLQMSKRIGKKEAEIFLAHLAILKDPYFITHILKDIRENGVNAELAVMRQVDEFGEAFRKMDDSYLRERGADLRDIGRRVIQKLMPPQQTPWDLKKPAIFVSSELTPSDTVRLDREKILAFVTESGGKNSHAAILARSLGIPAVLGIEGLLSKVKEGDTIIVDGDMGIVLIHPPAELIQNYQDLQKKRESYQADLFQLVSVPSKTLDGREIHLWANIGGLTDLEYSLRFGAYGIGLFRTELPFLVWKRFLSEEEQLSLYKKVVNRAAGRDVTIRTLDFGGDKFFEDGKSQKEKNPFLGYRSIRVFLKEKDFFKQQLRAILRASAFGPIKVLFPMISSIEEVRQIRDLFERTKEELRKEGIIVNEKIPFGIMIEVPSAAILADQLAKEVDFLSVGTNDLIQYTLAVDRNNDLVNDIYEPLNPAVLRLIQKVLQVSNDSGKQVTLCGEMAGTPAYVPLLVGIGLTDLSMNPTSLLEVKKTILNIEYEHWRSVVRTILDLDSVEEIHRLITLENGRMRFQS